LENRRNHTQIQFIGITRLKADTCTRQQSQENPSNVPLGIKGDVDTGRRLHMPRQIATELLYRLIVTKEGPVQR
jgi:hypothetical protein